MVSPKPSHSPALPQGTSGTASGAAPGASSLDVDPPVDLVNAPTQMEEFALGAETLIPSIPRPPWLDRWPPKKRPFNWPSGAKSPSWFRRMAMCPRNHAQRYRYRRPDPSGLIAIVGNVIHGAMEDAANIRLFPGRRGQIPRFVNKEELLYLIEFQKEAVRQDTIVVTGTHAHAIVTTEVLARAREIVTQLPPIDLTNLWIDPNSGKGGAEYIWQFPISAQFLVAGIADLVQVQPHPTDPRHPPLEILITDWKTGPAQIPTKAELELNPQACLQLIWAKRTFPYTPRIRFRLWNVTQQKQVYIDWSPGLEELTISFARACWNLWVTGNEEVNTGNHCDYCPYRNNCKGYQDHLREATYSRFPGIEGKTMSELIELRYQAKILADMAERRRLDCDKLIMAGLGEKRTYRHGRLLALQKSRRLDSYRDEGAMLLRLAEISGAELPPLITNLTTISKKKLEEWVMTLPVAKQETARGAIDEHRSIGSTAPWIEVHAKEVVI